MKAQRNSSRSFLFAWSVYSTPIKKGKIRFKKLIYHLFYSKETNARIFSKIGQRQIGQLDN